jgi:hypothetical protein
MRGLTICGVRSSHPPVTPPVRTNVPARPWRGAAPWWASAITILTIVSLVAPGGAVAAGGGQAVRATPTDCGPGNGTLHLCLQGETALTLGDSDLFWANTTGGTAPLKFVWNVAGNTTLTNASSETLLFTPLSDGLFNVNVTATDAKSNESGGFLLVTVTGPSPVTVKVGYSQNDSGQELTFNAEVSGGTGPYTYVWSMSGKSSFHGTGPNLTLQNLAPGNYTVSVQVTDAAGFVGTSTLPIDVQPPAPAPAAISVAEVELIIAIGLAVAAAVALTVAVRRRSRSPPPSQP